MITSKSVVPSISSIFCLFFPIPFQSNSAAVAPLFLLIKTALACPFQDEVVLGDLTLETLTDVRKRIPLKTDARFDVFQQYS